jgi:DNA-binding protein YbaB
MTDPLAGWPTAALYAQADEISRALEGMPARIRAARVHGEAGHGSIATVVTGYGTLTAVEISPQAYRHNDGGRLGALLTAAILDAMAGAAPFRTGLLDELTFAGLPLSAFGPDRPDRGGTP